MLSLLSECRRGGGRERWCVCGDSTALLVIKQRSKQQLQKVIIHVFLLNSKSKECRHELMGYLHVEYDTVRLAFQRASAKAVTSGLALCTSIMFTTIHVTVETLTAGQRTVDTQWRRRENTERRPWTRGFGVWAALANARSGHGSD